MRFQDHVTPLNAENLNGIVDKLGETEKTANNADFNADIAIGLCREIIAFCGNPITCDEFNKLGLTAQQLINKNMTTVEFAVKGKTLLIGG